VSSASTVKAVLWDFGGVLSTSPFEAFTRYEREHDLPVDFIRRLNAANHHDNAWAKHERNEVTFAEFCDLYEAEARDLGVELDTRAVMACLSGDVRPEMIEAVRRCHARLKTALLTNNVASLSDEPAPEGAAGIPDGLFDVVIESSKVGVRKPDPRFYEMACEALDVHPREAVFLDDLGVNLKPAREMGMHTIKVVDPDQALTDLAAAVGFPVR
jgi:putative hydrolase of the HAD superfamily